MSNCSNHTKEVLGQTDMKELAEDIGNLHYETLASLLNFLSDKLYADSIKDSKAGREKIARVLMNASYKVGTAENQIRKAWKISKPFMNENT